MNKIITAAVLVALASAAMGGTAFAKAGNGGIGKMPYPGNGPIIQQQQPGMPGMPGQPGKAGKTYGGDIASPGDAFIPGADETCDGAVKYEFDDSGILQLVCLN